MLEQFVTKRFTNKSLQLITLCDRIITSYQNQGYRLTLRQLYYQLVSKNVIANVEKSYKNLSALVSDARLAGMLDWDAIEDRVRVPRKPAEFEDLEDLVSSALASYRLPRWKGQKNYCELWVEKDALAGVLEPLSSEFHVTLMVNRGYSSQSSMYESSKRFIEAEREGQDCHLFYLGDHDPSGEDMVRDIGDRLFTFGADVFVKKIALTIAQVQQYNPPPNPTKVTDSRAAGYIAKFGKSSWEVDALPPNVLVQLIRNEFQGVVDVGMMDDVKAAEFSDKAELKDAVEKLMEERAEKAMVVRFAAEEDGEDDDDNED